MKIDVLRRDRDVRRLPSIDTVVVHLMDTEQRGGPRVTTSAFDRLLRLILRATPKGSEVRRSDRKTACPGPLGASTHSLSRI